MSMAVHTALSSAMPSGCYGVQQRADDNNVRARPNADDNDVRARPNAAHGNTPLMSRLSKQFALGSTPTRPDSIGGGWTVSLGALDFSDTPMPDTEPSREAGYAVPFEAGVDLLTAALEEAGQ